MCQEHLRSLADMVHATYPELPWDVLWSIVREYGVPAIRVYALVDAGATMPEFNVFPLVAE